MKVLITGATGFIGQHLIERFSGMNDVHMICVGRQTLNFKPGVENINVDLSSKNWTKKLKGPVDLVIHLAQSKLYRDFPNAADDLYRLNLESTFELLEWSRRNCVKRFFLASTGNVYRSQEKSVSETDPCEPKSFYSATKLSAEHLASQYTSFFNILTMRIFSVYGPGQNDTVIAKLIERIRNHEEIVLAQGKGIHITPLFILDFVEMLERLIRKEQREAYEIFNLCGEESLHLGEIVQTISEKLKLKSKIVTKDSSPQFFTGSNKKILDFTGLKSTLDFRTGIERTLQNV